MHGEKFLSKQQNEAKKWRKKGKEVGGRKNIQTKRCFFEKRKARKPNTFAQGNRTKSTRVEDRFSWRTKRD